MTKDNTKIKKDIFTRSRVYTGLLVFVVLVGGGMLVISPVRHRLQDRTHRLKAAIAGDIKPVSAKVGENIEPFPEEFARATPPVQDGSKPPSAVYAGPPSVHRSAIQTKRRIRIPQVSGGVGTPPVLVREDASGAPEENPRIISSEVGPKYQQGKIERDAYDMVLKSNKVLAEMVQGGNPALHFKSWDAALRGDDVYWVRVIFQNEKKQDVEYIWEVKLSAGEITPLSFNARALF
jgi:hypothetical protein